MKQLLVLACVTSGCASSDAPDLTAEKQAVWDGGDYDPDGEVIVIEGGIDACWDAGLCWIGTTGDNPQDPGDTGGQGGGGGGGPGGGPGDQPAKKECRREDGLDVCLDCCYYNFDKHHGWECRKYKEGSKKRKDCWEKYAKEMADCQVEDCGRPRPGNPGPITAVVFVRTEAP